MSDVAVMIAMLRDAREGISTTIEALKRGTHTTEVDLLIQLSATEKERDQFREAAELALRGLNDAAERHKELEKKFMELLTETDRVVAQLRKLGDGT